MAGNSAARSAVCSVASMAATTAATMDGCWAGLKAAPRDASRAEQ